VEEIEAELERSVRENYRSNSDDEGLWKRTFQEEFGERYNSHLQVYVFLMGKFFYGGDMKKILFSLILMAGLASCSRSIVLIATVSANLIAKSLRALRLS